MLAYSTVKKAIDYLLSTGLVAKIYHDVTLVDSADKSMKLPVYPVGAEFAYVGVDDSKIMNCYFRQVNNPSIIKTEFIGSAKKINKSRVTYRVVFFNDFEERNFDSLIEKFFKLSLLENIEFVQLYSDPQQLILLEAGRQINFNANTFYFAIDINVSFWNYNDDCNTPVICGAVLPNPIIDCTPASNVQTNEIDPVWNADKSNYYTKSQIDALLAGLTGDEEILALPVTSNNQTAFNIFNDPAGTVYYLTINGVEYFEDDGDFNISVGINVQLNWTGEFSISTTDKLHFIKL